jgi:hypothetical protein
MWSETLKLVLAVVIAAVLRVALVAIGVEIDEAQFNTIVAAIVVWIATQLGWETAHRVAPRYFNK